MDCFRIPGVASERLERRASEEGFGRRKQGKGRAAAMITRLFSGRKESRRDEGSSRLLQENAGTTDSLTESLTETEQVVFMVSEDEQAAHDTALLIRWRRIESLERSISPVARSLTRFDYQEISSATLNFDPGRLLGRGALGRVYKGRLRRRAAHVAVKWLQGDDKECAKSFCRELTIGGELRHPNVAPLLGFCVDSPGLFLVYKFVPGGTLDRRLHPDDKAERRRRRRGGAAAAALSWAARWKVAIGLARAVEYLHRGTPRRVVHRDIKPSNVLLSSGKTPLLCDFGLATWTPGPAPFLCKTVKGTFGYLAPEYFQHGKVSDKTDVYAYGVVLLELITGRRAIDSGRPLGDENLVLWATPILRRGGAAAEELLDPRLKPGSLNRGQLRRLAAAAAACLTHDESARPAISHVIRMLLAPQDEEEEEEEEDCAFFSHDPSSPAKLSRHLSVAMRGVSDDEEGSLH